MVAGLEEYWQREFGIGSFDQFLTETRPWLPGELGYIVKLRDDQIARIAWENPYGAIGLVVNDGLVVERLTGGLETTDRERLRRGYNLATKDPGVTVPQLIIPNVYRVGIYGVSGGQPIVNVVGVRGSAAGQAGGAADAVRAAWKVTGGPLSRKPSQYAFERVSAMDLSSADGAIVERTDGALGGIGSAALATNGSCALVKWNGGTRSGSSRGRMYFGPLIETDINSDGRTLPSTTVTALQTAMTNFLNSLSGAGFPLTVISPTTATHTLVTSVAVESTIATQRRRIRD